MSDHSNDKFLYSIFNYSDLEEFDNLESTSIDKLSAIIYGCSNTYVNNKHFECLLNNLNKINNLIYLGKVNEYNICSYNEENYFIDIFYDNEFIKAYFVYRVKNNMMIMIKQNTFVDFDSELINNLLLTYYINKFKALISDIQISHRLFYNTWKYLIEYSFDNDKFIGKLLTRDFKFILDITSKNYKEVIELNYNELNYNDEFYGSPTNDNRFGFFRK